MLHWKGVLGKIGAKSRVTCVAGRQDQPKVHFETGFNGGSFELAPLFPTAL